MLERVMTKKEKFNAIASKIFDIVGVSNYFYGKWDAVKESFNEEEKLVYNQLWQVYREGLMPYHPNNEEYDKYINLALDFVTDVVNKYVPSEQKVHDNGEKFSFDFLKQYLYLKEIEDWKRGSKFICILDENIQVKRLPLETNANGDWKNHLFGLLCSFSLKSSLTSELANFDRGLYEIVGTGERFDINTSWGESSLEIYHDDKETHSILKFIIKEELKDEMYCNEEYIVEDHTITCSRCKGGGCPDCDKSGFYGERVY